MRILLTNNTLALRAGTELYIRDVAIELMRRGHQPVVYSTHPGEVGEEIRAATVPVIDRLESLGASPDLIHAHHNYDAVTAMMAFPDVPVVSFCHGWTAWQEMPLRFPQILAYVVISEVCRERLVAERGIAPSRIHLVPNFFDRRLFAPRPPLPVRPRSALCYSNEIGERLGLPAIRRACQDRGIRFEAIGRAVGDTVRRPGEVLAQHDIVFCMGRSAIEAMAVGSAVVVCGPGKLGPMVHLHNFESLRTMNFGIRSLSADLSVSGVSQALDQYDAASASAVAEKVRLECELQGAVDRLIDIYLETVQAARSAGVGSAQQVRCALVRHLEEAAPHHKHLYPGAQVRAHSEAAIAALQTEVAALRNSATWRWSQAVLTSPFVNMLFGRAIRHFAGPARPRQASLPPRAQVFPEPSQQV